MKLMTTLFAMLLLAAAMPARAGELDMLLDRLVDKNVIEPGEAQEIRVGTQEEVKKEISQQRNLELPMWVQTLTFHGDMRLRYESLDNENKQYTRDRGRFRLRFYVDSKVNDQVYMGFGFASGSSSDPRSTNQTFGDNFGKKSIFIDYVFAEYDVNENLSFTAGRTKNPLWTNGELLWDSDINPEGLSAKLTYPLSTNLQVFGNAGVFVLNELANDPQDPSLLFAQPGVSWHDSDGVYDLKAGAAVYGFNHVQGHVAATTLNYRPSTGDGYQQANTVVGGRYKYSYNSISPELELNANILNPVPVPLFSYFGYNVSYVGVYGNYIQAFDQGKNNTGWIGGVRIGQRKVEDAGEWQAAYSLRQLEKDAWLDTYPDSDFFGGSTGVQGQKFQLVLGLLRGFALNLAYIESTPISGALHGERTFQSDINLKF